MNTNLPAIFRSVCTSALCATALSLSACASHRAEPPQSSQRAAQAQPSQEELNAKFENYVTRDEHHDQLNTLVGRWDTKVQMWMDPSAPPEKSTGHSEMHWILGKKFIQQTVTGKVMGKPFEGRGTIGYDKATNEYRTTWMDSQGTGMMLGAGQYDPATKTLTDVGLSSCPLQGEMRYRGVTTMIDPQHLRYEMFVTPAGAPEVKALQVDYTRAAAKKEKKA